MRIRVYRIGFKIIFKKKKEKKKKIQSFEMDEQKPRANRLDALPLLFHFTKVGQSVG